MSNESFNNTEIAIRTYLESSQFESPIALSLTPRAYVIHDNTITRLSDCELKKNLRHFFSVLKRRIFGNKRTFKWARLVVIEQEPSLHAHCIVEAPEEVGIEKFKKIVEEEWDKTFWGNRNVDVRACNEGWIRYILKRRSKTVPISECWDHENSVLSIDTEKFESLRQRRGF